jgi:hypothetical protein
MENLKLPAYPFAWEGKKDVDGKTEISIVTHNQSGFTKLEMASLMIARGMVADGWTESVSDGQVEHIAKTANRIAKAVLEEANK